MKFGPVAPAEAKGGIVVHSLRKGSLVLRKGTVVGDAALGLGGSDRPELHRGFSAPSRSDAVISPMIETAISGGDTAPIARPIGA